MRPDSLAVIGLGAIGGSLAWQARLAGIEVVTGYSSQRSEGVLAAKAGALTHIEDSPERAVRQAQFVVLATPPAATLELLERIRPHLAPGAFVSDVCSVKRAVIERARETGLSAQFAGAHPLAGTHESGWAAARPDRLKGAVVYVCPTGTAEGDIAARAVMGFWREVLGAEPVLIDAEAHDRQLAWTSHLPQAVASALSSALARHTSTGVSFGSGARDTTRLAGSSPEMWSEIFLQNSRPVQEALKGMEFVLAELRRCLAENDEAGLRTILSEAKAFRGLLDRSGNTDSPRGGSSSSRSPLG
ncbi:MAG: prephenate dehydrogenase/arogenate dehydrogenase family protein [Gemmatimonadota bacterium]